MSNKVLAISFKTANYNRSSICSIGLALYEDDKIKLNEEILVNPEEEFDEYSIKMHNINEEKIKNAKTFNKAWQSISYMIDKNTLVISPNASLDISVLIHACDKYNMIYPNFDYLCTWKLSNIVRQNEEDDLDEEIVYNSSIEEAYKCLNTYLNILKKSKYDTIEDLLKEFNIEKGVLFNKSYKPFGIKKQKYRREIDVEEIKLRTYDFENSHPFYKKTIVFTGALRSMRRSEAMKKVNNVGGIGVYSVTKNTDYLVLGTQSIRKLNGKVKSSKHISAERLISQGKNLKIITEDDFLELVFNI